MKSFASVFRNMMFNLSVQLSSDGSCLTDCQLIAIFLIIVFFIQFYLVIASVPILILHIDVAGLFP